MMICCFRKYKADIEAYISKLIARESTESAHDPRHNSLPKLPWRVWFCCLLSLHYWLHCNVWPSDYYSV